MKGYGKRIIAVAVVFAAVIGIFVIRLVDLQLIDGQTYYEKSGNSVATKTVIKATRGDILDRNCEPLVQSVSTVSVVINKSTVSDLNAAIESLVALFEKFGDDYINTFPVMYENGGFSYVAGYTASETSVKRFENYLESKNTNSESSLSDIMTALFDKYGVSDRDAGTATNIVAVRYEMETRSEGTEYVFAEDVDIATATAVEESLSSVPGIGLAKGSTREYTEEGIASHILGTTGRIYADEYETLKDKGYTLDDTVGKDGIEKICEDYLRGKDGYRYTVKDKSGTVVSDAGSLASGMGLENEDAVSGNTVILTIDKDMQVLAEEGLRSLLEECRELNGADSATAASVIFIDPNSAEILALANNPTYNAATFNADYGELVSNENKPLLNRAIAGLYAPGSTYKMVTAVAGLEEGYITENSYRFCSGIYTYYEDYQPSCFNRHSHGSVNVIGALKKSCNIFFFDLARIVGISKLNEYSYKFGFGKKTGIELPGEATGIVAGKTYRESLGKIWEDGETLLAGIGQSDNAVTPLQLVNYVATIGNGGKFYSPHIIQSIRNGDTGETVYKSETSYVDLGFSESTLNTVVKGMVEVAKTGGSAGAGFENYKLTSIAVKTGTAEVAGKLATSLLVGFAPAQNPEIAFVLVVEQAGTGTTTLNAEYITKVLEYWFSDRTDFDGVKTGGEVE